jgi:imidazoleglycerol-phosphate dehydratase
MRQAAVTRTTGETDIAITLNLDGNGTAKLDHPIGFLKHMLNTFAKHGLFDLEVTAAGDIDVDQHHLVEDTGIVLGMSFAKALADRRGIVRCGSCLYPMDETLARAAVDVSGRPFLVYNAELSGIPLIFTPAEGSCHTEQGQSTFQTDTIEDFWQGFVTAAAITLHLDILRGRSDHHKIEALYKAAARALRHACQIDPRAEDDIPSTKGVLA